MQKVFARLRFDSVLFVSRRLSTSSTMFHIGIDDSPPHSWLMAVYINLTVTKYPMRLGKCDVLNLMAYLIVEAQSFVTTVIEILEKEGLDPLFFAVVFLPNLDAQPSEIVL
jgi:hypothetical protein